MALDRYFAIRLTVDGVRHEEGLGWASEGWTLTKAREIRAQIKEAGKIGKGPRSLREVREANEREREIERKAEEDRRRGAVTVAEFWRDAYFPHAKTSGKSWRTWKSEEGHFRNWIEPAIGGRTLGDVSYQDLERIKRDMLKAEKASQTITSVLATIRQIFSHASKAGAFHGPNPVSFYGVRAPKRDNGRTRFLSYDEASRLLEALEHVPEVRDQALISLHCGLRFGEIAALEWSRVDLENGLVILLDTKGKRGRQIPMTPGVRAMFERRRSETKVAVGLVFPTADGGVKTQVSDSFNRAVESLGLNDAVTDRRLKVVFHTLRHTFSSWLTQDNVSEHVLMRLLGHSTSLMTQKYSHLAPGNLRAAVEHIPSLDEMAGESADEAKAADVVPMRRKR